MALATAIDNARAHAERLRSSGAVNEANTKAIVIEPLLSALGWELLDIDSFQREVRVYDGTRLDYALAIHGERRVYIEAKALDVALDDPKFVSQTVNYANNDGVLWCALTDGLRWKVFKTNESASMEKKLLFDVDLRELESGTSKHESLLWLIGQQAVSSGQLDSYGERVFADTRVRRALSKLATYPSGTFLEEVAFQVGRPALSSEALKRSLRRVLDGVDPSEIPPAGGGTASTEAQTKSPAGPSRAEYHLDHHTKNKSAVITELFDEVDAFGRALGADVSRRVRKHYVGYYRGKRSFFTAELQQQRIWIYLGLEPNGLRPWDADRMRDVTDIGHYGMGDTEFSLTQAADLDLLKQLVRLAYERTE